MVASESDPTGDFLLTVIQSIGIQKLMKLLKPTTLTTRRARA